MGVLGAVRGVSDNSGRRATFRQLRATFATRAVRAGVDVRALADLMGHADAKMTLNVYAGVRRGGQGGGGEDGGDVRGVDHAPLFEGILMPTYEVASMLSNKGITVENQVLLGHGSGGTMMKRIIDEVFFEAYAGDELRRGDDAATLAPFSTEAISTISTDNRIAFSTDSFVVTPHFFPGGDIGRLAVCGKIGRAHV